MVSDAMNPRRRKKQRNRKPVSCWPCRERKVRCDRGTPCATCKRRGHTSLCTITSPSQPNGEELALHGLTPHRHVELVQGDSYYSLVADTTYMNDERGEGLLVALLNRVAARLEPTHETDDATREKIFLGQNCAANFFRALGAENPTTPLLPSGVAIESAFGLSNRTALHPFGSLWSNAGDVSLKNVLQSLPAVETSVAFESRLCEFLQSLGDADVVRALDLAANGDSFHDAAWYGVLFGVLACGCQFHECEVAADRILRARVFVAGAFECLRLANLFGMPSEATIQAQLLIQLTIANDANPGMAWSLLGTTSQNAQSIGLHLNITTSIEWDAAIHPLWSAVWFLDSSLSLAFGRRPSSFVAGLDQRALHIGHSGCTTFPTFCSWTGAIHKLKLQWQLEQLDDVRASDLPISTTLRYLQSLVNLELIPPYGPKSQTKARTIHQRIEQLVSLIHIRHFKAEIHRVAALCCVMEAGRRIEHLESMIQSLKELTAAYCTLKPLSVTMANSWPILSATVSSALLLSGIHYTLERSMPPEIIKLIQILDRENTGHDYGAAGLRHPAYTDSLAALQYLSTNCH
ncbi:hypothetical protein NLG97_g6965 [Lecanicillium saksenae]|uniref:Uncharacterized protein n=1 Tax=Lecanicillium saksenae TaxID=468837 RepID=A0ACC1QPU6_9HYPO|nr:hypothetical protein NLG97_g6965 [Lecanicillium saksenae]